MRFAPNNVMFATLETIHFATVCVRNWTLVDDFPSQVINEMMDAIHAVPQMLSHWNDHKIDELVMHLSCFDATKWRRSLEVDKHNIPDLVQVFKDQLVLFENAESN